MTEHHLRAAAAQLRAVVQWIDNVADTIATAPEPDGPIVPPDVLRAFHQHQHDAEQHAAQVEAATQTASPIDTCDASMNTGFTDPLGPCVLRHGHDGPVHKDGNGATWWPRHTGHAGATRTTSPTNEGQPVQNHARTAHGHTARPCDALCADVEADRDQLRAELEQLRGNTRP